MAKKYTDDELRAAIQAEARKLCIKEAVKAPPEHALAHMLGHKSMAALRRLGKVHRVARYSMLDRAALVEALCLAIPDARMLQDILTILSPPEWELFLKAAGGKALPQPHIPDQFIFMQHMGYMQCYYFDDALHCAVPDEVKLIWRTLKKDGFEATRARISLLNQYALAAVSLYGIIKLDELIDIFNSQNSEKTDADELFSTLLRFVSIQAGYCFWEDWLVDDTFEADDFEHVEDLAAQCGGKPRFIPEKDAFLRYADPDYYEQTPQTAALCGWLTDELRLERYEAEEIVEAVVLMGRVDAPVKEVFAMLEARDIVFDSIHQVQAVAPLIMEAHNHTRMWVNKGHTPHELGQLMGRGQPTSAARRVQKVGRNEPCPCGSGKKYKRCCGAGAIKLLN